MKKIIVLLLGALMVLSVLSGCDKKNDNDNKLKVVTTTFPIYDWVKEILKDEDVDVSLLQDNGVDCIVMNLLLMISLRLITQTFSCMLVANLMSGLRML